MPRWINYSCLQEQKLDMFPLKHFLKQTLNHGSHFTRSPCESRTRDMRWAVCIIWLSEQEPQAWAWETSDSGQANRTWVMSLGRTALGSLLQGFQKHTVSILDISRREIKLLWLSYPLFTALETKSLEAWAEPQRSWVNWENYPPPKNKVELFLKNQPSDIYSVFWQSVTFTVW